MCYVHYYSVENYSENQVSSTLKNTYCIREKSKEKESFILRHWMSFNIFIGSNNLESGFLVWEIILLH